MSEVLGLDPSLTNFGWALFDPDGVGKARCPERGRFQTSSKDEFIVRYMTMRENLLALVKRLGVKRVGIEYPVFNDLWSEGMYGLYLYSCEALKLAQVDVVLFSPIQIKVHAREFLKRPRVAGKLWKMAKADMSEAAREETGGKGAWNHNEADAYWVARTGCRFWQLHDGIISRADLTPDEAKQFTMIHTFKRGKKAGKTDLRGILYREDERFFCWSQET